ncbi:MAG: hypothetical protein ACQEQS_01215 [Thermodesulfobacteriota bacterium]
METKPAAIITMLLVLFLNLFFHVWTSGQYKELSFEITKINQKKYDLLEKRRILKTELARLKSPERIEKFIDSSGFDTPDSNQVEIIK